MKVTLIFFFMALALAASAPAEQPIFKIIRSDFDMDPEGSYKFGYETENAITREEVGELKVVKDEDGKDQQVVVMRGSYSYPDPEGNLITVKFYADETGFHPEGAHIPVARK